MYKISSKIINSVEKYHAKLESWLDRKRKNFTGVKFQRTVFYGNALLPLLFVIAMMILNHLLRKCLGRYKRFINGWENQPPYVNHHRHHVMLVARISLTLSRHFSLSFNASGRSSGQHPVSSHSCWMYVRAFARPCVGVHKSTSLMSSSLLLQQCPACLVRLTWIVFVIGGKWPYSWCLVGCCRQDLFKIVRSILV